MCVCVCVCDCIFAVIIQHAKRMRLNICVLSSVPCLPYHIFPYYLINGMILTQENLLSMSLLIFSKNSV